MYIKVKDRKLFNELDKNLSLPEKWNCFIKIRETKNNLIIKKNKEYRCTNCNCIFSENKKINELCMCPNCSNSYIVKSNRLTHYEFKDELALLDRYNNYYIVRQFRLHTIYKNNKFSSYYYEYARNIYNDNFDFIEKITNDNVYYVPSGLVINYRNKCNSKWKYFKNCYYLPGTFIYYSYNLEKLLGEKEYLKYSMLWELAEHEDYFDLIYLIKNYNQSVEFLIKMNLYKLALCPKTFSNKKNFNERFLGLSKDYIPFIQKYNLNIDELVALSYLKVKNIDYIKRLEGLNNNDFDYLKQNINLITLLKETDFCEKNFFEYKDYLIIMDRLGYEFNRKNLYPKKIIQEHDKLLKEYKDVKSKMLNKSIFKIYKKIKCNTFKDKKYIIFPVRDNDSLIDESHQQNNCVRTYADRILARECDIYFMRLLSEKEKSLVTVEVRNNHIVQKKTKNNGLTTKEQNKFLDLWEKNILTKGGKYNVKNI